MKSNAPHAPVAEVWLTVPEAAERLRISVTAARQRIWRGKIPTTHMGRSVRVPLRFVNHPTAEMAAAIEREWAANLAALPTSKAA